MEALEKTKGDFLRAKAGIERALATTPDDRINWSPSPSARTPVQQVAHVAWAVKSMHGMLMGQPYSIPTPEQADREFMEWDRQFTTREAALAELEKNSAAFLSWLEGVQEADLNRVITFPFGMGEAPMSFVLPFMSAHIDWHAAQMAYMQTIYGDRDWHMQ